MPVLFDRSAVAAIWLFISSIVYYIITYYPYDNREQFITVIIFFTVAAVINIAVQCSFLKFKAKKFKKIRLISTVYFILEAAAALVFYYLFHQEILISIAVQCIIFIISILLLFFVISNTIKFKGVY